MSKKDHSSSKYLNSVKEAQEESKRKIKVIPKLMLIVHILNHNNSNLRNLKDDQVFFLSRLNKPAKYKKDSNFLSYLIYRIGKDDASGLAAQMTYHFVLYVPYVAFPINIITIFQY